MMIIAGDAVLGHGDGKYFVVGEATTLSSTC
jgi:hypothetical protein